MVVLFELRRQELPIIREVMTFKVTVTRRKLARNFWCDDGDTLETQVGLTVEANLMLSLFMTWKTMNI